MNPVAKQDALAFVRIAPDGRWHFVCDSQIFNSLATCETKWLYQHVLNIRPRGPIRFKTAVGGWWSEYLKVLYANLHRVPKPTRPGGEGNGAVATTKGPRPEWNETCSQSPCNKPGYDNDAVAATTKLDLTLALALAHDTWLAADMERYRILEPENYHAFGADRKDLDSSSLGLHIQDISPGPILMALNYWTALAQRDAQAWKVIAVESVFGIDGDIVVAEDNEVIVSLSGRMDLGILDSEAHAMPVDHKTVDRIDASTKSKWKPNDQFIGYCVAFQALLREAGYPYVVDRCCVNIAARLAPSENPRGGKAKASRFWRDWPCYSVAELDEYKKRKLNQCHRMRSILESAGYAGAVKNAELYRYGMYDASSNGAIMNRQFGQEYSSSLVSALQKSEATRGSDLACHAYGGCDYRRIDSVAPASRPIIINAEYEVQAAWSPVQTGEAQPTAASGEAKPTASLTKSNGEANEVEVKPHAS